MPKVNHPVTTQLKKSVRMYHRKAPESVKVSPGNVDTMKNRGWSTEKSDAKKEKPAPSKSSDDNSKTT